VATIQSYVKPNELYRYRSLKKFNQELEAIEQKYLFCAAFTKLNDPMEGMFSSKQRLRQSDDYDRIHQAIIENKEAMGICSFGEVHNQGPMWAHYADKFKGICIAYSVSGLLAAIAQEVTLVRVLYNETAPVVSRSNPESIKMILSYKNYGWRYEREWRIFAPLGKVFYANSECVTRVYLGSRISDKNRKQIITRLGMLKIATHQMEIQRYSMNF
jgi:hypothetical protein